MVSIEKLQKGIADYLDAEFMPSFQGDSYKKLIVGTVLGLYLSRLEKMILQYSDHPMVKVLSLIDDKGNIDIDTIKVELEKQMPKDGLKVEAPMIGVITFTKEDVSTLYEYITK